jgi:NADH-quinone oxidoreductase subunit M
MLWMFQRVNYGPVSNEKNQGLRDLTPREWGVIAPIVAAAILMGVLPNLFLRPIEPSAARMVNQVHAQAPTPVQARATIQPRPAPDVQAQSTSRQPPR